MFFMLARLFTTTIFMLLVLFSFEGDHLLCFSNRCHLGNLTKAAFNFIDGAGAVLKNLSSFSDIVRNFSRYSVKRKSKLF